MFRYSLFNWHGKKMLVSCNKSTMLADCICLQYVCNKICAPLNPALESLLVDIASVKHFHGISSYPYESYSWKRVSGFLASRIYNTYTTGHDLKTYLLCWSGSRCGQGPVLIVIWLHPTFVSMSLPLCKYLSRPRILPPLVPCTPFAKIRFGICTRLSVSAFSHLHHLRPHLIHSIYLILSHSLHSYFEQSFLK